jgi:hypothetical protein
VECTGGITPHRKIGVTHLQMSNFAKGCEIMIRPHFRFVPYAKEKGGALSDAALFTSLASLP